MKTSRIAVLTALLLLPGAECAWAGPCTAQIAQLQQLLGISASNPSGLGMPRNAGAADNADVVAALTRAKQADAEGNASECHRDLDEVRRLLGIN
jgi:hypothetical protein